MKQALSLFLQETLNNYDYQYFIEDNEIYRMPSNQHGKPLDNNYQIIGECFVDETHIYDEDDIFYKNTFHFYSSANKEHNTIMRNSDSSATRNLFLAFVDNMKLICPYVLEEQKYSLTSQYFKYYNAFILNKDDLYTIALPVFSIQTKEKKLHYEFTADKLQDIDQQVDFIHNLFKTHFFKDIVDKTVPEMSQEEKNIIRMYYSN